MTNTTTPAPEKRYTHFGIIVEPVPGTLRHVVGGRVVDVRVLDPRTTCTYAVVNADNVIGADGNAYAP